MRIQDRSFEFACRIARLYSALQKRRGARRALSRQLLRSGTSIGANLEEASAGQSKRDFISTCSIAAKEARETHYWLRLLKASSALLGDEITLIEEANELVAILTSIVRNAQQTDNRSSGELGVRDALTAYTASPIQHSTFNIQHSYGPQK